MADHITIECVSGNKFTGAKLGHQRELPINAKVHNSGQEMIDGMMGRSFTVYRKDLKRGNKYYIVYSQNF